VLILHSELGVLRGGGENFTRNLFGILTKRDYDVSAAFVAPVSGSYEVPLPPRIKAIPLRGFWRRKPGQRALAVIERHVRKNSGLGSALQKLRDALDWRGARWHDLRFQKRVSRRFAGRWTNYDVVYVHSNVGLAAEAAQHRPTVLRLAGPASTDDTTLLRSVPVVCANGDALIRMRSVLGNGVEDLPPGVDFNSFSPTGSCRRDDLGWSAKNKVIGYVGRLSHLKGVDLLGEAFRQVAAKFPEARLILIGHGEQEEDLRHRLAEEIKAGKVHMVPGLSSAELPEWYRTMDVFVLPSRYENFSNALLEAAACGVPAIASDVGGNRIFQKTGELELFECGSATDLARRLSGFLTDSGQRRARALAFSKVAPQHFSWSASADRFEFILRSRLNLTVTVPTEELPQSVHTL